MFGLATILRNLPMILGLTLAGIALCALIWLVSDHSRLKAQNALLGRSVASLEQQITASRIAAQAEAERAEEFRLRSEQFATHIETIMNGGITDAPLDPALIDLLERMRNTED